MFRARLYEVSGKGHFVNTAQMDQDYQMIDACVDEITRRKIQNLEYINFCKLINKQKLKEEDQRMEIVSRNGMTFLAPISYREATQINSYFKREQSFRIYSNILTTKLPGKATELLQYNHTIQTASTSYAWENMYSYDREFRQHI